MTNRERAEKAVLDGSGGALEQVDAVETALNEAEARGRKAGLEEASQVAGVFAKTVKLDAALLIRLRLV